MLLLRIKIPVAGHLTITSPNAKRTATHNITKPGTYTITLQLIPSTTSKLQHKRKLTIKLHTTYRPNTTPTTTTTTTTLLLKQKT